MSARGARRHADRVQRPEPADVAVLIVRLWSDGPGPDDVRARVVATSAILDEPEHVLFRAGREQIVRSASDWVDECIARWSAASMGSGIDATKGAANTAPGDATDR